ncbi:MAG: HDIG domain-containing metalloprotein [Bacillota bacterium]|jgi:putative nucleotidyltransferase with HDIG domain|nr:HDIG domain-containing protein [Clostridia bacterium]
MSNMQELFWDIDRHLLHDEKPSRYLNTVINEPIFCRPPLNLLYRLVEAKQNPQHHPEGSVWNHTMLVVDEAAKVKNKSNDVRVFMWAALLHDIGKPDTTKNRGGRITSYNHDKLGAKLAKEFLEKFTDDTNFIEAVAKLIRWHMQILFVVKDLPFADIKTMKQQVDINEVALLGLCDRLGRLKEDRDEEEKNIKTFIEKCNRS